MLLGLSPLVVLEAFLFGIGYGDPDAHVDPFAGFSEVRPLFVKSEDGSRIEIAESRREFFRPDSFPAAKSKSEFRIFCLGGSTVQGRPFAIETSFGTWLQIALREAHPDRDWNVVNCGGISYASYRLVPILEEVLTHEPDLIVLCTGHNEFLERRTYARLLDRGPTERLAERTLGRLRTFTLLREAIHGSGRTDEAKPVLPTEVTAELDFEGGLAAYHRDDAWRDGVMRHFDSAVRRMITLCDDAGVRVLLLSPPSNLRDQPPFKSEHRADLSPDEKRRWERLVDEAVAAAGTDLERAAASLEEAVAIDDLHAGGHYELGRCYDGLRRFDAAERAYRRARERDVCPLRILDPMRTSLSTIARETNTPLLDAEALFVAEQIRRGGVAIPDDTLLVDHVHPSIRGHQLIANAILDRLAEEGLVTPVIDWTTRRGDRYREHFESLDSLYFLKGRERLKALRGWAAGRSRMPRE